MRDSKLVYSILYANASDTAAKSYMEQNNEIQCGRKAWFSVEALYEGSGNNEHLIRDVQQKLNYQTYTGNSQVQALPLTKRLFDCYKDLAERGSPYSEIDKLRHLRRIIKIDMATAPWYVNGWKEQADLAMQEYSDNGTASHFGYWMTLLCNGEATFKTDSKLSSARISSASTGGGGSASGGGPQVREFDATTGEPLNWQVNGIIITVFYGNIGKAEKQANIPRLAKGWFQKNPQAKCPP